MGRAPGQRNPKFEEKRAALCRAMVPGLLEEGQAASLKSLAVRADVSVPTLRHYFKDREGAIIAALEQAHRDYVDQIASEPPPAWFDVSTSLRHTLEYFVQGWLHAPLSTLILGGLTAGLESEALGVATISHVIEPTLQGLERRLTEHVERGELSESLDVRHGALALFSPVLLALMHQHHLQGRTCRPLDIDAMIRDLVAGFVRAHAVSA